MSIDDTARPARLSAADFTALYTRSIAAVYRYCLARSGAPEEAEDLAAETFRAALERLPDFDPARGTPLAWLFGIARRKLADHHRRSRPGLPLEWIEGRAGAQSAHLEEAVDGRLNLARAAAALQRLTPERAEALALHFFAGLDLAEVAAAMGRSPDAARKLIERGLADLRRILLPAQEVKS